MKLLILYRIIIYSNKISLYSFKLNKNNIFSSKLFWDFNFLIYLCSQISTEMNFQRIYTVLVLVVLLVQSQK